jgi:hypothetical protein
MMKEIKSSSKRLSEQLSLLLTVRFDRPINPEEDMIVPGDFVVRAGGEEYHFDFKKVSIFAGKDPHVVDFLCCELDTESYPASRKMCYHLREIDYVGNCCFESGSDSPVAPVELRVFQFIRLESTYSEVAKSTNFIDVEDSGEYRVGGLNGFRTVTYTATRKLLEDSYWQDHEELYL